MTSATVLLTLRRLLHLLHLLLLIRGAWRVTQRRERLVPIEYQLNARVVRECVHLYDHLCANVARSRIVSHGYRKSRFNPDASP